MNTSFKQFLENEENLAHVVKLARQECKKINVLGLTDDELKAWLKKEGLIPSKNSVISLNIIKSFLKSG